MTARHSWEKVSDWYDSLVGDQGHYYHQHIVIPGVLALLDFAKKAQASLLDLACGQGVLARHIPKDVEYCGVDISKSLIAAAKKRDVNPQHHYLAADICRPLPLDKKDFSHATCLLALQNVPSMEHAIDNAYRHLRREGRFVVVLNHPCFRIPRQSSWGVEEAKKLQFRRIDRYMTPMQIPIQAYPSTPDTDTISSHFPLSSLFLALQKAGFLVETLQEWRSDKISTGPKARMENRAREEFPLFLAINAIKPR